MWYVDVCTLWCNVVQSCHAGVRILNRYMNTSDGRWRKEYFIVPLYKFMMKIPKQLLDITEKIICSNDFQLVNEPTVKIMLTFL